MSEIEITQADREAAMAMLTGRKVGGGDGGTFVVRTPSHSELAEAFARHRHEARKAALLEAAGIADAYSDMCAGSDQPETQGACSGAAGAATAIRSAVGGE